VARASAARRSLRKRLRQCFAIGQQHAALGDQSADKPCDHQLFDYVCSDDHLDGYHLFYYLSLRRDAHDKVGEQAHRVAADAANPNGTGLTRLPRANCNLGGAPSLRSHSHLIWLEPLCRGQRSTISAYGGHSSDTPLDTERRSRNTPRTEVEGGLESFFAERTQFDGNRRFWQFLPEVEGSDVGLLDLGRTPR
jgi:hypothetical protein